MRGPDVEGWKWHFGRFWVKYSKNYCVQGYFYTIYPTNRWNNMIRRRLACYFGYHTIYTLLEKLQNRFSPNFVFSFEPRQSVCLFILNIFIFYFFLFENFLSHRTRLYRPNRWSMHFLNIIQTKIQTHNTSNNLTKNVLRFGIVLRPPKLHGFQVLDSTSVT